MPVVTAGYQLLSTDDDDDDALISFAVVRCWCNGNG